MLWYLVLFMVISKSDRELFYLVRKVKSRMAAGNATILFLHTKGNQRWSRSSVGCTNFMEINIPLCGATLKIDNL